MLSDENIKKINNAVREITKIIASLENSMVDPRAISLLDIACSYLEEQRENKIEYSEEDISDDLTDTVEFFLELDDDSDDILNALPVSFEEDTEENGNGPFRYLENDSRSAGDVIAEQIIEWYNKLDSENEIK